MVNLGNEKDPHVGLQVLFPNSIDRTQHYGAGAAAGAAFVLLTSLVSRLFNRAALFLWIRCLSAA